MKVVRRTRDFSPGGLVAVRFWHERGCAIVIFEGQYDADAALVAVDDALRISGSVVGLLLDLSDSLAFRGRSSEDLRGIAGFLSTRRAQFGSRLAMVGQSDLTYGLLRMGAVFTSEHGIASEAFRSRDEAMAWLSGSPGDEVPASE